MKLSELTLEQVKEFCGASNDDSAGTLELIKSGALSFVLSETGLTAKEADEHADLTLAALVLMNEMYTNRTYTVDSSSVNPFADQILSLHRVNLL